MRRALSSWPDSFIAQNLIDGAGRDERVRVMLLDAAGDHFCGGFDIVARNTQGDDSRIRRHIEKGSR